MNITRRHVSLLASLAVAASALFAHTQALRFAWYWRFDMADKGVHVLVGLSLGILFAAVFAGGRQYVWAMAGVLGVSFLWEMFEYATGMTFISSGLFFDTAGDALASVAGAMFGVFVYKIYN